MLFYILFFNQTNLFSDQNDMNGVDDENNDTNEDRDLYVNQVCFLELQIV
jgi:hypothetical protein